MSSNAPDPLPRYVYKIVPEAPPSPLPSPYPLSELDQKDGFVHLSTASQIPITSDLFFNSSTELWVLKLDFVPAWHGITNWDVPNCPHLFGNFDASHVASTRKFLREEGQSWKDVMAAEEWLDGSAR